MFLPSLVSMLLSPPWRVFHDHVSGTCVQANHFRQYLPVEEQLAGRDI